MEEASREVGTLEKMMKSIAEEESFEPIPKQKGAEDHLSAPTASLTATRDRKSLWQRFLSVVAP